MIYDQWFEKRKEKTYGLKNRLCDQMWSTCYLKHSDLSPMIKRQITCLPKNSSITKCEGHET